VRVGVTNTPTDAWTCRGQLTYLPPIFR
jgi:hypothetical protein